MNVFDGREAIDEIARLWALHDSNITSITLHHEAEGVVFEARCTPRPESPVLELRLRLVGVTRFELRWASDEAFYCVPGYKAAVLKSGAVYFSFDPYDDREALPDERDGGVVEALALHAEFTMKH